MGQIISSANHAPRFENVSCSQCGNGLGPGDAGYSHCRDHASAIRLSDAQAAAMDDTMAAAAAVQNAGSLVTWITTAKWFTREWRRDGGHAPIFVTKIEITQAPVGSAPDPHDLVPQGATVHHLDTFRAERFGTMPIAMRRSYKQQHRDWLMWDKAQAMGKPVGQLQAWVDFDPVAIAEDTERWAAPTGRYAGD